MIVMMCGVTCVSAAAFYAVGYYIGNGFGYRSTQKAIGD